MVQVCGITYEIDVTIFIEIKNHFNCFWNVFLFFNKQLQVVFSYEYTLVHHDIHSK